MEMNLPDTVWSYLCMLLLILLFFSISLISYFKNLLEEKIEEIENKISSIYGKDDSNIINNINDKYRSISDDIDDLKKYCTEIGDKIDNSELNSIIRDMLVKFSTILEDIREIKNTLNSLNMKDFNNVNDRLLNINNMLVSIETSINNYLRFFENVKLYKNKEEE